MNTKWRAVRQTCKSVNFSRRKRAAACFLVIEFLEERMEKESGERMDKGMDQKEKRKWNVNIGGRIAIGGHCRLQ